MNGTDNIQDGKGKPRTQGRDLKGETFFIAPLALALLISRFLFAIPPAPGTAMLQMLVYAAASCFAAILFVPVASDYSARSLKALIRHCAAVAFVFVLAVLADPQTRGATGQALPLATMVFLLTLAALTPVLVLSRPSVFVRQAVLLIVAALAAAPLWLAPLAEQSAGWTGLSNLIVALSPLSAMAASLQFDYLRVNWFYQHSVLGSLRYEYLSWTAYALSLTVIVAGFVAGAAKPDITGMRRMVSRVTGQSGNGVSSS